MIPEFNENELPFVQRAERYCAGDEQCVSSVRTKLMTWGADRQLIERILQYLCREDFINEQRYAHAYCKTKMRGQKWGRIKLSYQLRSKLLPREVVEEAIASIDPEEYHQIMIDLAVKKWKELEHDTLKGRSKLAYYLQSHGYEAGEIQDALKEVTGDGRIDKEIGEEAGDAKKKGSGRALITLALLLLAGGMASAQNDTADLKIKHKGTWTTSSTPALKLDQHYYQNWSATGISQFSFLGTFDGDYKYSAEKFTWDNVANLALGLYWQDLDGDTSQHGLRAFESRRKNDDKIDLTSTFSMKLRDPWNLNAIANFKSQFFPGYNYTATDTALMSNFMAPAYLTTSIGFECKKEFWNISFSFLTGKTTFLLNEDVVAAGQFYGVDTSGGARIYAGLGSYFKFYFKKEVAKNLLFYTRLELFYDYRKPRYHDNITRNDPVAYGAWDDVSMMDANAWKRGTYCLFHDTDIDFEYKLEYRFNNWLACYTALHTKYDSDFAGTHRFFGKEDSHWQLYESTGVQIYFNWKTPST
ncbi:MAG: RecX family transcriptional regulator [Bacteroidales bacterium]|nr:RecX family transcriptional regulator [Bacteroidales bacterium]